MSLRRWVSVFALLGVLAQAVAIPRHNAIMLAGALAAADETLVLVSIGTPAESGAICRTDGRWGSNAPSGAPGSPGKSTSCPICLGLASAHAILPSHDLTVQTPFAVSIERVAVRDMRLAQLDLYRPRARGPPVAS